MHEKTSRTRRQLLRTSFAVASGVVAVAAAGAARAQEKIDQKQVQYQLQPKDGQKCSLCVNWVAPNSCKIVAGTIDPNGWCVAFAPKQA